MCRQLSSNREGLWQICLMTSEIAFYKAMVNQCNFISVHPPGLISYSQEMLNNLVPLGRQFPAKILIYEAEGHLY